jgi:enoyl-CoA hydratase/carnithine racemase
VPKVLYDKRDRIAYVTVNRPEAKNAIDPEAHELLKQIWADFRDDDALEVAILTGTGDSFCAGADLKTYIPPRIGLTAEQIQDAVDDGFGGYERLIEEAELTASQILRNSQRAVRSAKRTILDVIGLRLDEQLELEAVNAYSAPDRDETMARLQRFYDRTDEGRVGG